MSFKLRTKKFVTECDNCGNKVYSRYTVKDFPCPHCDNKVSFFFEGEDGMEQVQADVVEVVVTKENISFNYSIITNAIDVFYEDGMSRFSEMLIFTIINPELKEGFPMQDFPSQYNEDSVREEIKEWILENYMEVFRALV